MIRFTTLDIEPVDLTASAQDRLEAKELAEQLRQLPVDLSEALFARIGEHAEGLSCRALAKRCGVSHQTIYNRVKEAEQMIRNRYGETGNDK